MAGEGLLLARESKNTLSGTTMQQEQTEEGEGKHSLILKLVNLVLLVGALGFLLRKPLRSFLATRSQAIREGLDEGRKALHQSQARLEAIEEKLGRLQEEIANFKAAGAREMESEGERLHRAAAEDAEKIMQAARAQIEASARAAKLDLKVYAAERALRRAEDLVRQRLDDEGRHQLVDRFVEDLKNGHSSRS
jgi:F-type H+-transporting ATPase subunit b